MISNWLWKKITCIEVKFTCVIYKWLNWLQLLMLNLLMLSPEATLKVVRWTVERWSVITCSPSLLEALATTAWCLSCTSNTDELTSQNINRSSHGQYYISWQCFCQAVALSNHHSTRVCLSTCLSVIMTSPACFIISRLIQNTAVKGVYCWLLLVSARVLMDYSVYTVYPWGRGDFPH